MIREDEANQIVSSNFKDIRIILDLLNRNRDLPLAEKAIKYNDYKKIIKNTLNEFINFGYTNIFENVYNYLAEDAKKNKEILNILLSTITNDENEEDLKLFIIQEKNLISEKNKKESTLNDDIKSFFDIDFTNEFDLIEKARPYYLDVLLRIYFNNNNKSEKERENILNNLLEYCVDNNLNDKINYLLSKGATSKEYQKKLFIDALKNKDLIRINIMWNPLEYPLDITKLIGKEVNGVLKETYLDKYKIFRSIEAMQDMNNSLKAERLFDKFLTNSYYIAQEYKAKYHTFLLNNFSLNVNKDSKNEPEWIDLVRNEIKEKIELNEENIKNISKAKDIEDNNLNKNKNKSINHKSRNEVVENDLIIRFENKKSENSLLNLNNELITRVQLQKAWDKKLIHSFYNKSIQMINFINEFYQENNITKEHLEKNNIIIDRMPIKNSQLYQSTHQYIANHLNVLNELLFNENKNTIIMKEEKILNLIVKAKIKTSWQSHYKYNNVDNRELSKTSKEYKRYNMMKELRAEVNYEYSKHNWNKVK